MKPDTEEIAVSALIVGDVIVNGKGTTVIRKITPCSLTALRGIPKIHVNGNECYDTIARVEIRERKKENGNG